MEVEKNTLNRNLPAELWREIFEKIPKKERGNIPQVNSFFYKIICDMEAFKRGLVVIQENLNHGIEMLLWSKRKIRHIIFYDIHFDTENLTLMTEILEVHGATVEIMSIYNQATSTETTISFCQLINFFQLTPKLKILIWEVFNVKFVRYFDENVLPELKLLHLSCNEDLDIGFSNLFTPGTIGALTVNSNWIHLESFISRQTAIKYLTIRCEQINVEIFNCLKLMIKVSVQSGVFAQILMKHHPELEIIDITDCEITTLKTIEAYCKMEFLKSINIVVNEENINEIHRISQMAKLSEVSFLLNGFEESSQFVQVTTTKLEHVEKVRIKDPNFMVMKELFLLETAGRNWPKVKEMNIDVPTLFDFGRLHLNEYFDNFKNLEKLIINCYPDADLDELTEDFDMRGRLHQNTCIFLFYFAQYPNIKWLEIHHANINHFSDLICALPNLEYLEIDYEYGIDYTPRCLQELSQLKKLKEIKLKFAVFVCKNFSEMEAAWLKKVCNRLRKFEIEFVGFPDFYTTLRYQIRGCDFIEAELVEAGLLVEEGQSAHFKLTNVEY